MKCRVLGLSLAAFLSMTAAAVAADKDQTAVNNNVVINAGAQATGPVTGFGNSVSISATGALTQAASVNSFLSTPNLSAMQSAVNLAPVINNGTAGFTGSILGGGNSVSISATGAAASISASGLNDVLASGVVGFNGSSQTALNTGLVSNTGVIAMAGGLGGFANSLSISSTGALAQASITNIGNGIVGALVGGVPQIVANSGPVSNQGVIVTGGGMLGTGNSMSIASTGAAASASVSSTLGSISFAFVGANQNVINAGTVTNSGTIVTASIAGTGNSASVQATGALAQASITSVGGNVSNSGIVGTQTAVNNAAVVNAGNISNAGGITGNFNSQSISAVGAAAVATVASLR